MTAPPPTAAPKLNGNGKGVIVKQTMSSLYCDPGDEALHKVIDTHFDGYEWVLLKSYDNTDPTENLTDTYSMSTDRYITSGSDVNKQWDFVSEVNGLSIKYDDTSKTFNDYETKSQSHYNVNIKVAPSSKLYLYQKRYKFTAKVWFILDAWGSLWTVGNWKSSGVAEKTGTYYVDSKEHYTQSSPLTGTKDLSVTQGTVEKTQTNIKQFQDCTRKCQDYLHNRGV
ncbi:hypothetical protein CPB83DRAFT_862521 [Crepidotus variabilis]|uniref:Uncharacterized protein n=1 Tax=Crepidotus variabilis TaxID=179855 RepID=A0A9P6E6X5_9AGAR|nr:hypothetical protein CPB83DRAFT_862521 [Crepidotus variabilis]